MTNIRQLKDVFNPMKLTVYIVGAGASKELNFPIGEELKPLISNSLNIRYDATDKLITGEPLLEKALTYYSALSNPKVDFEVYRNRAHHIAENIALQPSIDNFIDTLRNDKELVVCGKLSIAHHILDAEARCKLFPNKSYGTPPLEFDQLNTWHLRLYHLLTENCTKEELYTRFSNISFIIFNYDRCLEQFLFIALSRHYELKQAEAAAIISRIQFIHVYGQVGLLPWQRDFWELQSDIEFNSILKLAPVGFGSKLPVETLVEVAQGIKTFTEGADEHADKVEQLLNNSQRVVFMGFHFNSANMKLLGQTATDAIEKEIFATAYLRSKSDIEHIKDSLKYAFPTAHEPVLAELKCLPFMNDYWSSLGFSGP